MRRAMLLCAALGLIGCHDGEEGADPVRSESFELDLSLIHISEPTRPY